MLSFAFSNAGHSHITLLLANLLVVIFLCFEARRFRYFDVWRSRVRMLEENFFIPIIRRNLVSPRTDWREYVAEDLDQPTFKLTFLQAVGIRLRYNYIWILLVILLAWLAKLNLHPLAARGLRDVVERAGIGPFSGEVVVTAVGAFYAAATGLAVWAGGRHARGDEIHGVELAIEHWKT